MPASLALLLFLIYIFVFLRLDRDPHGGVSKAMFIPFAWMCIAGSRYVGQWLKPRDPSNLSVYLEGSPVDRAVFIFLILAGVVVLIRRKLPWREVFTQNIWVWLYFLYGLISITWADYPFVALKRWVKGLGTVVMVLIILTETKPYKALEAALRKMAIILLPLSVLFIKYIPQLGRAYHRGRPMYTGVAGHKNGLGILCLVAGVYFCWMFLYRTLKRSTTEDKALFGLYVSMAFMIVWLTRKANSATSLSCLVIGIVIILLSHLPAFRKNPQKILTVVIAVFVVFISLEAFWGVKETVFTLLGREPTLTSRVPMWKDLISMVTNPVLGFGYDSFWLGARQEYIYMNWGIIGNAHNGYLEMYLNLGLVGVFFIAAWYASGLAKIRRRLQSDYPVAILRFVILLVTAIHGYTEASFYGVSLMWVLLFLAVMEPPRMPRRSDADANPDDAIAAAAI
jgi:exopolysaccharide production protein ExoQ